jgi:hypothetical protein
MPTDFTSVFQGIEARRRALPAWDAQGNPTTVAALNPGFTPWQGGGGAPAAGAPGPRDWFQDQVDAFRTRADSLDQEENRRYREGLDLLKSESEIANRPSFTKEDEDVMGGQAAERASADANVLMENVRAAMGNAGIAGGGVAGGLAAGVEMERAGQITGAFRDARMFRAQQDAQDARERFQRSMGVAGFTAQDPAMVGIDSMQDALSVGVEREGNQLASQAARDQAKASKKAAKSSSAGGVIGSVVSRI